jgi:hypothetical protein
MLSKGFPQETLNGHLKQPSGSRFQAAAFLIRVAGLLHIDTRPHGAATLLSSANLRLCPLLQSPG